MGVGTASHCLLFSADQMLGARTKEEGYEPTRNGIVFSSATAILLLEQVNS
jgi:hypothetical protein